MGRLVYSMSVSLDGFVDTAEGSLDWVLIDEELHKLFNDEAREADAFLYGRRMYELMAAYWPTAESDPTASPVILDFARLWGPKPKIVFSRSLKSVEWNSRLASDDVVDEVRRLKERPGFEMMVGGPTIAAPLIRAGLVDEFGLAVHPVALGASGGTPFFPADLDRVRLELADERRLASGVVYLRYRLAPAAAPSPRV